MIDTHLHVWDRSRSRYAWLEAAPEALQPTHSLADVEQDLTSLGVAGAVLVQADETLEETAFLLEVARGSAFVLGAVVYLPLHQPEVLEARLPGLQEDPAFCGVRNLTHDRPDPDWILQPAIARSLAALAAAGVPADHVGVLPRHLEQASLLADAHPELTLVVDHLGKPPIGAGEETYQEWLALLRRAAERPNVTAKLSGLYGHQDPAAWTTAQVARTVHDALEAFGADRLMLGSDWPVCVIAGDVQPVVSTLLEIVGELSEDERRAVTEETARRVYGLTGA